MMKSDWWWVPQFLDLCSELPGLGTAVLGLEIIRNKGLPFHDHLCVCNLSAGQGLLPTVGQVAGWGVGTGSSI